MLILLIYLISGWRWSLFTSDVPLLGKTDERTGERERERALKMDEYQKENKRDRIAEVSGPGGGMAGARCDYTSQRCNEVRCGWTFDIPPGSTFSTCLRRLECRARGTKPEPSPCSGRLIE